MFQLRYFLPEPVDLRIGNLDLLIRDTQRGLCRFLRFPERERGSCRRIMTVNESSLFIGGDKEPPKKWAIVLRYFRPFPNAQTMAELEDKRIVPCCYFLPKLPSAEPAPTDGDVVEKNNPDRR